MNNLISVIITTYKRDVDILCRAIESVLNQTYEKLEIIVINDYPENKDMIELAMKKYGDKVKVYHNEKNSGACYSRNVGLSRANGEYVAFLDDDDEWINNKLEKQILAIDEKAALVYCTGINVYSNGNESDMPFIQDCTNNAMEMMLAGNCMGGCSFPLIKKKVLDELGGFDIELESSQDYDLWIRIVDKYSVKYIGEPLVRYYIMDDSITSSLKRRLQGYYAILRKHRRLFKQYPHSAISFLNNIVGTCVANKQYNMAIMAFGKSFEYFPNNIRIVKMWMTILLKKKHVSKTK